ncbi:MAG: serine acetyltransferase [Fibrobacterota bacterium]|nr:serine acetyltransferase [Fibrobacterota bacterium]QQS07705.1 MAG: serine acetyltransferase [Fibrobacterota bacterium]
MAFLRLMSTVKEFRNLFYYRTGLPGKVLSPLCPPLESLHIVTPKIGPGLFIQHGFATIIAAREIGANCWINQQVTIGYSDATSCPTLGDQVTIAAGAKVIGNVTVGDRSVVGANAVVVKDIPPDVTVVGGATRIVRRNGQRVEERL